MVVFGKEIRDKYWTDIFWSQTSLAFPIEMINYKTKINVIF